MTEDFTAEGDIDYGRLARWLEEREMKPQLTLEQAVEAGTPQSIDVVEAHRLGVVNTRKLFAGF